MKGEKFKMSEYELYHYGTPKMQWGVRRYQNADGTWTAEGLARRRAMEDTGKYYDANNKVYNYQSGHVSSIVSEGQNVTKAISQYANRIEQRERDQVRSLQDKYFDEALANMNDDDIRRAINRLQLEQQYKSLSMQDIDTGRIAVGDILNDVGTALALAGSVTAIGLHVKTLMGR